VDLNRDDHLIIDEFAIAMRLIQRQAAGEELPRTLPLSLILPRSAPNSRPRHLQHHLSLRLTTAPTTQTGEVSVEHNSISMKSRSISHIIPPTPFNLKYLAPLPPPVFSKPTRLRSRTSVPSTSDVASPASK